MTTNILTRKFNKRDLYHTESTALNKQLDQFRLNPELLEDFLAPVFDAKAGIMDSMGRNNYVNVFYSSEDVNANETAPRKYFAQPNILGFNIFDLEKEAWDAGYGKTYETYLQYAHQKLDLVRVARVIILMGYSLLTNVEVAEKLSTPGEWEAWLETMKSWYAEAFLHTPWYGKQKEHFADPHLKSEVSKYNNLRIVKTAKENDMKYMIDYMVLLNNQPLFGVSIKGMSHYWASQSNTNAYYLGGEKREKKGHAKLMKEWGVPAYVVHSDTTPEAVLTIIGEIREALKKFETKNIIERKQK